MQFKEEAALQAALQLTPQKMTEKLGLPKGAVITQSWYPALTRHGGRHEGASCVMHASWPVGESVR